MNNSNQRQLKAGLAGDDLISNHLLVYLGPPVFLRVLVSPISSRASRQALTHHTVIFHVWQLPGTGAADCLVSFGTVVHSAFSLDVFLIFLFWSKWPQVLTMQW